MVNLSQADAVVDLKKAIEGRIQALSNVHSLFVATRWIGAELSTIAGQELAPYSKTGETHVRIGGPEVLLEPNAAQALAVTLHELATNAAKYGSLSVPNGQIDLSWSHQTVDLICAGRKWAARPCRHLRTEALADALLNK